MIKIPGVIAATIKVIRPVSLWHPHTSTNPVVLSNVPSLLLLSNNKIYSNNKRWNINQDANDSYLVVIVAPTSKLTNAAGYYLR